MSHRHPSDEYARDYDEHEHRLDRMGFTCRWAETGANLDFEELDKLGVPVLCIVREDARLTRPLFDGVRGFDGMMPARIDYEQRRHLHRVTPYRDLTAAERNAASHDYSEEDGRDAAFRRRGLSPDTMAAPVPWVPKWAPVVSMAYPVDGDWTRRARPVAFFSAVRLVLARPALQQAVLATAGLIVLMDPGGEVEGPDWQAIGRAVQELLTVELGAGAIANVTSDDR